MARSLLLLVALAVAVVSGCRCFGSQAIVGNGPDGGDAGGADGGQIDADGGWVPTDAGDGASHDTVGPGQFSLDAGAAGTGTGVGINPSGYVVLNIGSIDFSFMWIANSAQGWVSKYDTRTGKEVGRYWSTIPKDCAGGLPCTDGHALTLATGGANSPSRTAIDLHGDVWVANRAPGQQASVTKIANDVSACIDRDGDGTIHTSKDLDGDGQISANAADGEMVVPGDWNNPLLYDECVLFSTPIGSIHADVGARAIAISRGIEGSAGDVWVGHYGAQRFYKLNPDDGQPVAVNAAGDMSIDLGWGPYGAAVDSQQRLWVVQPGLAWLGLIDTKSGILVNDDIRPPSGTTCGAYAIGIDGKDRVWLPGLSAGSLDCRYEHPTGVAATPGTWTSFSFPAALGRPRGIAADDQGNIFMSVDQDTGGAAAKLIKFDAETGAIRQLAGQDFITATDGNSATSIGVGLDADGHPWVNNYSGNAMRIDKDTGAILRTAQQPSGLYTYSDFTGYQLRKFTAPRGTYRKDLIGCSSATHWLRVEWSADTPPNTAVKVFVKAGDTTAALDSPATQRFGPFASSPADLATAGVPRSQLLRVEFILTSADGTSTPALKTFDVAYTCELQ